MISPCPPEMREKILLFTRKTKIQKLSYNFNLQKNLIYFSNIPTGMKHFGF
jgi:hypothetical protein